MKVSHHSIHSRKIQLCHDGPIYDLIYSISISPGVSTRKSVGLNRNLAWVVQGTNEDGSRLFISNAPNE